MPLQYLLPCKCGRKTPVSESLAGIYITCDCGRSVPVPRRNRLFELEPVSIQQVLTPVVFQPVDRGEILGVLRAIGVSICVTMVLVVVLIVAFVITCGEAGRLPS